MKYWERISASLAIALIMVLLFASIVMAVPGNVVFGNPNPSDTSMVLNWTKASGSMSTIITYRIDTYPATPIDGTISYNGTASQCTVSNLVAGTTYYFSAWGYDGAYSPSPAYCVMNTLAVALLSGGEESRTPIIPVPTVPASANQAPDISGFNLEPFTSIINYFNDATKGGLGMPVNYAWEVLAIGAMVAGSAFTYIKMKNFFIAYFVLFILTVFFIGLHLVQGYLAAIEIIVGAGVWAIERYLQ